MVGAGSGDPRTGPRSMVVGGLADESKTVVRMSQCRCPSIVALEEQMH